MGHHEPELAAPLPDGRVAGDVMRPAVTTVETRGHLAAARYAPFGFGYRRCGGEQLIELVTLCRERAARLLVAPHAVVDDNIGLHRAS
jgi:hypothetical protein